LHPHDGLLRAARARWAASPGLREDYSKHRANVERAVAQAVTWRERRLKLRHRGVTRNNAWPQAPHRSPEPGNLASRGLTRRDGAWILAT
jgi:hypothetical protein